MHRERYPPPASGAEEADDTELAQAIVRFWIGGAAAGYILIAMILDLLPTGAAAVVAVWMGMFFLVSTWLFAAIRRHPGVRHGRRALAMLNDYGSTAFVLSMGDRILLPIFMVLIWITLGYGMRYGPRYLLAGTVSALLAIATVTMFSDFWRAQPFMVATFILAAVLVPAYAHVLLTRTRRAHEEAQAANRAMTRFLAQASHDLRQPVHAIGLFTDCLRAAPLGPEERVMVDRIDRSLQSVSRLFRSLLDVATLDSGRVVVRQEVVDLGELLREIAAQNSEAVRWAEVDLRVVPTRQQVLTDPGLLATVVQNLVSNALKYAPAGSVLVGCRRRNGGIAIEVHDRGRGIAPEHLPHVFDEFYRGRDPDDEIEGVGLGLSIVKRMAALMDLKVTISSVPGRGTSAALDGLRLAPPQQQRARLPRRRTTPLDGLRILLIEDDREVRDATAMLLASWGCETRAVAAAPAGPVACDLIVADLDLGGLKDGRAAVESLRAASGRHIPAVLITGHEALDLHDPVDRDTPVLAKPVRPAELRAAIAAQWLGRAERPVTGPPRPQGPLPLRAN
ncbi:ATP-binding protein [Paracoccus sp. (in: a-proteobacteria)]|uniref:hybrid sensor histidine kinase/response regulator n=1 Tax=Paracoccus sp. TaxID=267 RepID=UPI0026DF76E3|nr:ATP-binding protein [Paracoccus sp. (in: a-proteobacteria)]MDO5368905.1 ATP-binding protein [Paracoccus sp. (in: a-proteobacteria)]